ncbi:MAG: site-specific DNA-methyltransferase [Kiritimatiellia bacterium]
MKTIERIKCSTPDFAKENVAKLLALFPEVVCEGKIDFEALKTILGGETAGDERYQFTWAGKRAAMFEVSTPIAKTLRPCLAESKDWETTQNIYIEGDNLDALKLLQNTYGGKVKMIYIDPPCNTGHDFIYHDNFRGTKAAEAVKEGTVDAETGERFRPNTESNGYFHSDWCSMMYPRLKLARNLLRDDGVIFISIDDNEVTNLRRLCDEVFGECQFQGILIWKTKTAAKGVPTTNMLVTNHDYVLVYAKNTFRFRGEDRDETTFSNPDNDPRGPWKADNMKSTVSTNYFEIIDPNTGNRFTKNWAFSRMSLQRMIEEGKVIWPDTPEGTPRQKRFLAEMTNVTTPLRTLIGEYQSETATNKLKELFDGKKFFDFPKPIALLQLLVKQGADSDSIILDFFSGSATTAHAVMQLNAEDGGNRKFIMVQLPEVCAEGSEAAKAGYKNICEIGKERIRRAGEKIKAEHPLTTQRLDVGFRVFKVDSANLEDVFFRPDDYRQGHLLEMVNNVKTGRTGLDLLFGCLLEWGLPIDLPTKRRDDLGTEVYDVDDGHILACFDMNVTDTVVRAIAARAPGFAIFRDLSFTNSAGKINVGEIFKTLSPHTKVKVL